MRQFTMRIYHDIILSSYKLNYDTNFLILSVSGNYERVPTANMLIYTIQ